MFKDATTALKRAIYAVENDSNRGVANTSAANGRPGAGLVSDENLIPPRGSNCSPLHSPMATKRQILAPLWVL